MSCRSRSRSSSCPTTRSSSISTSRRCCAASGCVRPRVATRDRALTQPQALALHDRHAEAAGLRWWSTFESQWLNVTLFDRAASALRLASVHALDVAGEEIAAAADVLGLRFA